MNTRSDTTRTLRLGIAMTGLLLLLGVALFLVLRSDAPQDDNQAATNGNGAPTSASDGDSTRPTGTRLWAAHACCMPEMDQITWASLRPFNLPLNNPPIVPASEADFLRPDDTVVGVLLGKQARAYPWWMLANYHAVNDHIDGTPVIVNLCEACNGAAAFLAYVDDMPIDLRPCGLKHGTWFGIDFQTGSYWYPFVGLAFEGPLAGTKLERIRTYFSTWEDWLAAHPHTTVVLSSDEVRNRPHGRASHMAQQSGFNPDFMQAIMDPQPNPKREWLEAYELVFGLIPGEEGTPRAWTLEYLRRAELPIKTRVGEVPVVVLLQNQYQVGAYVAKLGDVELQLERTSSDPLLLQDQLGNIWNAWGRTESGPDHRAELDVADGYVAKWYEWIENFPDSELVPRNGL